MSLEHLLQVYGYPVLFIGTFVEGETPQLMAAFLAYRGYLSLPWVILVGFAGTFTADQFFFHLGRTRGRAQLERRPAWQPKAERARALLDRYGPPLIVAFRFLYGLRIVTPFVVGMSGYSPIRFLVLNVTGGLLWSVTIAGLGYSLGELLSDVLHDVHRYEGLVLLAIVGASALGWLVWLAYERSHRTQ